jgi:hypothetical protein
VNAIDAPVFSLFLLFGFLGVFVVQFYKYFHMDGIGKSPIEGLPNEIPRHKDRIQLIAISLIHSARMLSMRRSGIFLRHSFIVAPLLSLNGTLGMSSFCRLGMSSFCRLLLNSDLLFLIAPTSQDMSNSENATSPL